MYSLRQLILGVWFVVQFCAVVFISFFVMALSALRYQDIYRANEGFWTREEIISNVLSYISVWSLVFTAVAVAIFFINQLAFAISEEWFAKMKEFNSKKFSIVFALICWLAMIFLVLSIGIDGYLKYSANLPT